MIAIRASFDVQKISTFKHLSRILPLKPSQYPFSQGLLGLMYSVPMPSFADHCHRQLATNSGPLPQNCSSNQ